MLSDLLIRLRALFRRKAVDDELDEELRFHFDQQVEKLVQSGLPLAEARRRSRIAIGGAEKIKEECREARGINLIETLVQDVRFGVRILSRAPVTTGIAILSLALGIGANTAIFSLIDSVMLRFLPVQRPQELAQVLRFNPTRGGDGNPSFTNPLWEEVRDHQDVFSGVFSWSVTQFDIAHGGAVHFVDGVFASGDYFTTLGVRAAAGRLLTPNDDRRGCPAAAVLSYGFWQEHFGGEQSAVGGTISLKNLPFEIMGVSAPGFTGVEVGRKFDVAVPVCAAALFNGKDSPLDHRSWWWLSVIGRVKPGMSAEQVKARLAVISPEIFAGALPQDWDPDSQKIFRQTSLIAAPAATGKSYMRRQFNQPLHILMAVVGFVLLIACANIASLMFARASSRSKEIAVRKALGASRARLIRQLLVESLLLSTAGTLLGIVFARWSAELLVRYISTAQNKVSLDLSPDARILAFTAAVAVFTGLLFGVFPALRSTRISLTAAMKGSQAGDSEQRSRFNPGQWIVGSQVALSLALLVVAGLFLRSLVKLVTLDIGFDRSNVLLVNANLSSGNIPAEQRDAVNGEIESRLRSLSGVIAVGRSLRTPVSNFEWNQYVLVDSPNAPKGDDSLVYFNFVSPGYFETLRTPVLQGRDFNPADTKNSAKVAVVNNTFARKFFPGMNPMGKFLRTDEGGGKTSAPIQIVGLVKDSKYESLREDTFAQAFFPATQITDSADAEYFLVRTDKSPSALTPLIEVAVAGVNKGISLESHTLAAQVDDSLVQERLLATLSAFFGALALLLAMIGLYGAMSYLVAQRRTEFGVRIALGAPAASILRLVMRDVGVVLLGGIAAGIAISLATVRVLHKLLFGLTPYDAATMLAAIAVLAAVALFAGYLPARRAMRVDPMVALRYE